MKLRIEKPHDTCAFMIPRWYGVAYSAPDRACIVMWIIPLNIAARWLRRLRLYLKSGYHARGIEREIRAAYANGYKRGHETGESAAFLRFMKGLERE